MGTLLIFRQSSGGEGLRALRDGNEILLLQMLSCAFVGLYKCAQQHLSVYGDVANLSVLLTVLPNNGLSMSTWLKDNGV